MSDSVDLSLQSLVVDINQSTNGSSRTEKVPSEYEVFISYRENPDQGLAVALRELIEGAIEPRPRIFVAGAGGLRPSNIGYKPQIQAAAQSSRAFIAIITQQSKERQWLFFEAGAAWGRNQLYVPLLVGTSPDDLATTMADYQTVRASNRDEVEHLLSAVAEAVGGKIKRRFSQRYRAFSKRIEAYQKIEILEENIEESSSLSQAIELLQRGEVEEANTLFNQLEETASTNEEKATIRIARLLNSDREGRNPLKELESLAPELRNTYHCQFWLGLFESRVAASISYYEECLRLAKANNATFFSNRATLYLAEDRFKIGEQDIALDTLQQAMVSEDRDLRSEAVETWQNLDQKPHFLEKLVILLTGLSDKPDSSIMLNALTELALDNEWSSLLTYFAERADKVDAQGTAANNLGRAYSRLKLYSLAYLAYAKAAEAGISVAKVNIAHLHLWNPLPAAGLKLLQEHTGTFDAADAGYPYHMRSELERSVQNERKKAEELYNQGCKVAVMISHFGWETIRSNKLTPEGKQIELESGITTVKVSESNCLKLVANDEKVCLELTPVGRTIGLWQAANRASSTALYCFTESGYMFELSLHLTELSIKSILQKYPILSATQVIV
ncbi:TIR domain-containing protein [Dendronalium sp. ChiSLP03b]|uniref:TIR domain-containing protein n=1 Tax=Dendronalium sp. ChiSLP03b TaxID=3075381 RepID=UPI002AD4F173|nr:TIR domain-containing protein [Dendronalium sp. ChiSLP03b]MDZ8207555.1 TIR domain-containing protein [Dendronalium sp. ChiSLP03b]